jgi:hypothetical protein
MYFCKFVTMKKLLLILSLFILLGSSCTKSKERSSQAAKDYALVLSNISEVTPLIVHTIQSQAYVMDRIRNNSDTLNSCASYLYIAGDTVDIENGNVVIEVLFSQCMDFDGVLKNGSLIVNISNYFDVDSAECTVQLTDFSINNNIFSGTLNLKRKGSNEFEITTNNVNVIVGTKQISYEGTWLCTMGTGADVGLLYDNLLEVEEIGELVDKFGSLVQTIGSDLHRDLTCNWFNQGIAELEDSEGESQILDFGDGSCDNVATVTLAEFEVDFAIGQ